MSMHCRIIYEKWNWNTFAKTYHLEEDLTVANCEDKILWLPKCIGFLSRNDVSKPYRRALAFIIERKKVMDPNIPSYMKLFTQRIPSLKDGFSVKLLIGKASLSLNGRKQNSFPSNGKSLKLLLKYLHPETIVEVWKHMLLESNIVILGDNVSQITETEDALHSLLYPLQWVQPFIPILFVGILESLQAPFPFFAGLPRPLYSAAVIGENDSDILLVDITASTAVVLPSVSSKKQKKKAVKPIELPPLVKETLNEKLRELERLMKEEKKGFDKYYMQKLFVDSIIYIFKNYEQHTSYLINSVPNFNTKAFLSERPQKKEKTFYNAVISSQMFTYFLQRQESKELKYFIEYYDRFKNKIIYNYKESNSSASSFEDRRSSEKLVEYSAVCSFDQNANFYYSFPKMHKQSSLVIDYMTSSSRKGAITSPNKEMEAKRMCMIKSPKD